MTDRRLGGYGHGLHRVHADRAVLESTHLRLIERPCHDLAASSGARCNFACVRDPTFGCASYELGMTPGPLSGHCAMAASSTFRCWATNAGGVCFSQLDREISS